MNITSQVGGNRGRRAGLALGVLLLAAGAVGCAAAQPAPPAPISTPTYRVAPPDQLLISVLPEPVIDRTVIVRPDGKISIDLVGDVEAAGRTTEEIAKEIQTRIGKFKRDAVVTVSVTSALSSTVTILGEVDNPSSFPLTKDTRVIEALGKVGGPTHLAATNRIRVIRTTENVTSITNVDLDAIEAGDLRTCIMVQGGDIIYVPPTIMAEAGYWLAGIFFPFQQLLGFGSQVAVKVFSGGAF